MMSGVIVTEHQLFIRLHMLVSIDYTVKSGLNVNILAKVKNGPIQEIDLSIDETSWEPRLS
jgi:hypothetical protein